MRGPEVAAIVEAMLQFRFPEALCNYAKCVNPRGLRMIEITPHGGGVVSQDEEWLNEGCSY